MRKRFTLLLFPVRRWCSLARFGSVFCRSEIAAQNRGVSVDTPVAKERPVPPDRFNQCGVAPRDDDFFLFAGFRDITAERVRNEGMSEAVSYTHLRAHE